MNTHIQIKPIAIHFQGENILNNEGNDGDIFMVWNLKKSFQNSFNYQNSMAKAKKLELFKKHKCEAFTFMY